MNLTDLSEWSELWRYPALWLAHVEGEDVDPDTLLQHVVDGIAVPVDCAGAVDQLADIGEFRAAKALLSHLEFRNHAGGDAPRLESRLAEARKAALARIEARIGAMRLRALRTQMADASLDERLSAALSEADQREPVADSRLRVLEREVGSRERAQVEALLERLTTGSLPAHVNVAGLGTVRNEPRFAAALWRGQDALQGRALPYRWPWSVEPPLRTARWLLGHERAPAGFVPLRAEDEEGRRLVQCTERLISERADAGLADGIRFVEALAAYLGLSVAHGAADLPRPYAGVLIDLPFGDCGRIGVPERVPVAVPLRGETVHGPSAPALLFRAASRVSEPDGWMPLGAHDIYTLVSSPAPPQQTFVRLIASRTPLARLRPLEISEPRLLDAADAAMRIANWIDEAGLFLDSVVVLDRIVFLAGGHPDAIRILTAGLLRVLAAVRGRARLIRLETVEDVWAQHEIRTEIGDSVLADLGESAVAIGRMIHQLAGESVHVGVETDELLEWATEAHGLDRNEAERTISALTERGLLFAPIPGRVAFAYSGTASALLERVVSQESG